jgi:hypothetical protein
MGTDNEYFFPADVAGREAPADIFTPNAQEVKKVLTIPLLYDRIAEKKKEEHERRTQ